MEVPECDSPSHEVHKSEEKTSHCPTVSLQAAGNYLIRQILSINYPMHYFDI
jgi:hypothetical protein